MDAVGAFLNSDCKEELYLELPDGYKGEGDMVAKLEKTLYGLKQSPKIWQDDVREYLIEIGFTQCEVDHCTYIKHDETQNTFTAIYVHVDDMAITGNNIDNFKQAISKKWDMDDLGIAKLVVGIEISRPDTHEYSICQSRYAEAVLKRFDMKNCRPASTPFPPGLKLYRASDHEVEEFQKLALTY